MGITTQEIAAAIKVSPCQVRYALKRDIICSSGSQVDELEQFNCSSQINWMMTFFELAAGPFQHWGVSENLIRKSSERQRMLQV